MVKAEPTDLLNYATVAAMPVSATTVPDLHAVVCVCACLCVCTQGSETSTMRQLFSLVASSENLKTLGAALRFCDSTEGDECQDLGKDADN